MLFTDTFSDPTSFSISGTSTALSYRSFAPWTLSVIAIP